MNENELKQQYANYIKRAYNITTAEYANKGYTLDENNSSSNKVKFSKVDMKNSTGPKAKVTRVLIESNPEFTFEYFKSYITGKTYEPLPAFNVYVSTNNFSLSELTESERKALNLPPIKRIDERSQF